MRISYGNTYSTFFKKQQNNKSTYIGILVMTFVLNLCTDLFG